MLSDLNPFHFFLYGLNLDFGDSCGDEHQGSLGLDEGLITVTGYP